MSANAPIKIPRLKLKVSPKVAGANAVVGLVNEWIDDLCSAIERSLKLNPGPGVGISQSPAGTTIRTDYPETFHVQLTGTVGADGGYEWTECYPFPPIRVTAGGSGLTSPVSITITPTNAGSGSTNGSGATATGSASSAGNLIYVQETVSGHDYTTAPTMTSTGGTTITPNWPNWTQSSRTSTGADLAYELNGNRFLAKGTTVYKVTRHKANGALIFDGGDGLIPVLLNSGIGTGSYASPTQGIATILKPATSGPGFVAGGTAVIYNQFSSSATAGKFGWAMIKNGFLYLVVWDC